MSFDFSHHTALVTGGTSGIGRAITLALADAGCQVLATGLTAAEIEGFDIGERTIETRQLDVTDEAGVRPVVAEFDRLDILVQCAGTILRGGREHEPAEFAKVIDVNLTGAMRVCAACKPLLAVRGGSVVHL